MYRWNYLRNVMILLFVLLISHSAAISDSVNSSICEHSYEWSGDEDCHWRACKFCGQEDVTTIGSHWRKCTDDKCNICGLPFYDDHYYVEHAGVVEKAEYVDEYSCKLVWSCCGMEEIAEHSGQEYADIVTPIDDKYHSYVCSMCHSVINEEHVFDDTGVCYYCGYVTGSQSSQTENVMQYEINTDSMFKTVLYGRYEQDNNTENGPEPIEWYVLDSQGNWMLLLSKYALWSVQYSKEFPNNALRLNHTKLTWRYSDIRNELNNTFLRTAFNEEEQAGIVTMTIDNNCYTANVPWEITPCELTTDKIFLLSYDQACSYFGLAPSVDGEEFVNIPALAFPTEYAREKAKYDGINNSYDNRTNGDVRWWLRTTYSRIDEDYNRMFHVWHGYSNVIYVNYIGLAGGCSSESDGLYIRPAMWVNPDWIDISIESEIKEDPIVSSSPINDQSKAELEPDYYEQESNTSQIAFYAYTVRSTNVREKPNKDSTLYWNFPNSGVCVEVLESVTGNDGRIWYKLMLPNDMIGYARSDFFGEPIYNDAPVYQDADDGNSVASSVSGSYTLIGITNRDNVNIREDMDKNNTLIAKIPKKGTSVIIKSDYIGSDKLVWYMVEYNGFTGFIRSDFITVEN